MQQAEEEGALKDILLAFSREPDQPKVRVE